MVTSLELKTRVKIQWCPGCGNFGILTAVKAAISEAGLEKHNTVLVSGIGCSGKTPQYVDTYGFEGIHGRILPVATGIKLSNHKLTVIGHGGDGDGYGIGMCHFMHALRRNVDMTYIVHDNQIYGLTKGQYSPTSDKGFSTKSAPAGAIEEPVNPMVLAITGGATFVSRGFVGELDHLKSLIIQAIKHRGFALVDILQPCVSFNYKNTYKWYKERTYKLEDSKDYNPEDKKIALENAFEWGDKIPIGILYKETRSTYEDFLPQIKDIPLVEQKIEDIDITEAMREFI
ncbi:MAG TPA: 2-oxoacid:ferredoxin oxidoreductase subunit beta [candidate division Zixibacteria bacterium]|jgi:2-oxoglutarate ferredoxin oxidoreductase subunit beta